MTTGKGGLAGSERIAFAGESPPQARDPALLGHFLAAYDRAHRATLVGCVQSITWTLNRAWLPRSPHHAGFSQAPQPKWGERPTAAADFSFVHQAVSPCCLCLTPPVSSHCLRSGQLFTQLLVELSRSRTLARLMICFFLHGRAASHLLSYTQDPPAKTSQAFL
jgi:hypothetical protein